MRWLYSLLTKRNRYAQIMINTTFRCDECNAVLMVTPSGACCPHGHGRMVKLAANQRRWQKQAYLVWQEFYDKHEKPRTGETENGNQS